MELIQKPMEALQKAEVGKFYINSKGSTIATVLGESMFPIIQDGWKVKIKPVNTKEIACGDVIAFGQNNLICHRLFGKFKWNKKIYLIHKGDSKNAPCGLFEEKDLVGKITEVFDKDDNKINEERWQKSFDYSVKMRLIGYIYLLLFLAKRALFGKGQNKLTQRISKLFWHFSEKIISF